MTVAPIVAWVWPELGATGGVLHAELLDKVCVAMIFFLTGLAVRPQALMHSAKKWKLHLFMQLFCFTAFPVGMMLAFAYILDDFGFNPLIDLGFFVLACLPTSISTCVVLTTVCRGDRTASLFSALLSNVLAVFLSPIVLSLMLGMGKVDIEVSPGPIIGHLLYMVFLPLVLGQVFFRLFSESLAPRIERWHGLSSVAILFISYSIFCDSILSTQHMKAAYWQFAWLFISMSALHFCYFHMLELSLRFTKFSRGEKVAVLMTAPQKTLALGLPLIIAMEQSGVFHGTSMQVTIVGLPLLIYHHIQLLISSALVPSLTRGERD